MIHLVPLFFYDYKIEVTFIIKIAIFDHKIVVNENIGN